MKAFELPKDITEFLEKRMSLSYSAPECVAGEIRLVTSDQLCLELFPMHVRPIASSPSTEAPGCYLIPAVNLVRSCSKFHPHGLLLWVPLEKCYGTWDSTNKIVELFSPQLSWTDIAADPVRHINSFWGDSPAVELKPLEPSSNYEFDPRRPQWPKRLVNEQSDDAISTSRTIMPRMIAFMADNILAVLGGLILPQFIFLEATVFRVALILGIYLGYFLLCETLFGRTLGKFGTGLIVVRKDGTRISFKEALIRTAFRLLELNPILLGALPAMVSIMISKNRQRIGDHIAGTIVVNRRLVN